MPFSGFTPADFGVFELPGYEARMPALRERVTPKLKELGAELEPRIAAVTGTELVPHVALHLRRSVNAPEETWVAFSRDKRGYKPYVHYRVAINGLGMKVACYLEEYAEDKPMLAEGLKRNAKELAAYLAKHHRIRSHDHEANYGKLQDGRTLNEQEILQLAERLAKVKSQHANFAIRFTRDHPAVQSDAMVEEACAAMGDLAPLYLLGAEPGYCLSR